MVLEPCEVCSTWRVEFTEPSGLANTHIYIELSYTIVNIVAKLEAITLPFSMEDSEYESLPTEKATVHLAAGALAGVMEHCVMYPVDCVKVRWDSVLWWLLYLAKNINDFQSRFGSRQILLVFADHMVELFLRDLQLLKIAWNWIIDIMSSSVSALVHHFFLVVVKSSKVANYLFRFHLIVFIEWHICSRECLNLLLRSPFSQSPPRKELAFYPSFNYHNMDRFHNIPSLISIWIKWIVFYFSFFKRRRQYANTLRGILKLLRVAENEFREFINFYT